MDHYIRVDLKSAGQIPGLEYKLSRADANINVVGIMADDTTMEVAQAPNTTVEVEWPDPFGDATTLRWRVRDQVHNKPLFTDDIIFTPFTSMVVIFLGELQNVDDPRNGGTGLLDFAQREYDESDLDIYLYEDSSEQAAKNDVIAAINTRGVHDIAIMGYSHGGGATYNLERLLVADPTIVNPFSVVFTSYIDAIKNTWDGDNRSENRRPPTSVFHLGQYQTNSLLLVGSPSGGNFEIDWTSAGLDHYTIDDDLRVLGELRDHLRFLVSP